ncbi:YraN family protein [Pedobacter sp. MC2016-05]|uniref:YraN family protein n=1 Tax=Pedobacter sp. MC2016-05 TaxID=2994474 RepID=UPI002247635C|nr:YraN family protein [Pedobacter sp. MC2016-05]MCX2474202.1 YraN family protein [Pedobacter sp. MC2016-05]
MIHNALGGESENIAKQYLEGKNYEVLDENWTHGKAEIDLIVYKDGVMVFVEVKARTSVAFGQAEEFVHNAKQKQMELAAT